MTQLIKQAISANCKKLGHPEWEIAFDIIIKHYEGYPLDYLEDEPSESILKIIKEHEPCGDPHDTGFFAWDVARLTVFCNQAFVRRKEEKEIIPWNPLVQSYKEFTTTYPEHERLSLEDPYPPENHIRMWFYMQVKD